MRIRGSAVAALVIKRGAVGGSIYLQEHLSSFASVYNVMCTIFLNLRRDLSLQTLNIDAQDRTTGQLELASWEIIFASPGV